MVPAVHDIEERIRAAKLGACPRQTRQAIGWRVGGATGLQQPVLLRAIIGRDTAGCAHGERLHGELLNMPARDHSTHPSAGAAATVRAAASPEVLARLRALPTAA
jgi:hypothetical protein